jgi:acyl dehydratase
MSNEITVGKKFDLGVIVLTEQEIIDFALAFDPLDFHTNKEKAEKTIFKGLIASGPHIFNYIYRREWIPRFGSTVICGMGVSNWKFIKPIYAGQEIFVELHVLEIKQDQKPGGNAISWQFEFKNKKGEMVQLLQMEVMHKP